MSLNQNAGPMPVQFRDLYASACVPAAVALTPNPATVTTGTTSTQTATVTGANVGDLALVSCQQALGNVQIGAEVTAANTVTVKWSNTTAGSIIPPAGALYNIVVLQATPGLFA